MTIIRYMKEHGWGHATCHKKSNNSEPLEVLSSAGSSKFPIACLSIRGKDIFSYNAYIM